MDGEKSGSYTLSDVSNPPADPQANPANTSNPGQAYPPGSLPGQSYPPAANNPPAYYPPTNNTYPPANNDYPPSNNAYFPAPNVYPPLHQGYSGPPQVMQQQQSSNNVVVVGQQPTQPTTVVLTKRYSSVGQPALVFAIFVSIFAFLCCWWALFCSIPALILANNATSATTEESAKSNRNISLILSGVTIFTIIAGIAIVFVVALI